MLAKQTRDYVPDMAFLSGAGDENRTRTISLGIRQIEAVSGFDLGMWLTVHDRIGPLAPEANGLLMARGRASHTAPET